MRPSHESSVLVGDCMASWVVLRHVGTDTLGGYLGGGAYWRAVRGPTTVLPTCPHPKNNRNHPSCPTTLTGLLSKRVYSGLPVYVVDSWSWQNITETYVRTQIGGSYTIVILSYSFTKKRDIL